MLRENEGAQTTNNQSKQYLELKKEWTQSQLQTTIRKSSEKIPQKEVVKQEVEEEGSREEGEAKRKVRFGGCRCMYQLGTRPWLPLGPNARTKIIEAFTKAVALYPLPTCQIPEGAHFACHNNNRRLFPTRLPWPARKRCLLLLRVIRPW